jgi:carbonic anhydrase
MMKTRLAASVALASLFVAACGGGQEPADDAAETQDAPAVEEQAAIEWSYEGEGGPANWAGLDSEYAVCGVGQEQSPIDLTANAERGGVDVRVRIAESASGLAYDNGHSVQMDVEDAGQTRVDNAPYRLAQLHFHGPSEHTVDGEHFPLEVHFVHVGAEGVLAVVGVFFEEGEANPALDAIFSDALGTSDAPLAIDAVNLSALLPEAAPAWRYSGSLTTPPCSEGVAWTVMRTPITASAEQIAAFNALHEGNYRPVQPLNERTLARGGVRLPQ